MKLKRVSIFPISFQMVLIFVLIFMSIVPALLNAGVLVGSFRRAQVDNRRVELKNSSLILADKISGSAYLSSDEKDKAVDAQIDTIADMFDGRIVIIDSNFTIIKDTFNIAHGKKSIAEEVIRTFHGENTDKYSAGKEYIIQTLALYNQEDTSRIEGVMLITSSTEDLSRIITVADDRAIVFTVTLAIVFLVLSVMAANVMIQPFMRIKNGLLEIADGNFAYNVEEKTYILTDQISGSIQSTLDRLRTIDQSREEFVANVSHELKTPITSIRVLADSLLSMEEAPEQLYKEFLNDISEEIDRESKIIDDLLSLVKLDKADAELITEKVNINELINLILKRLRPIAAKRNIELTFESIRDVEAEIDETKFSLAINNLVENAVKYNKDAGYVKVSLDADHKFFYVKVADGGIGIPEDLQELVFDRFYRVDKARSRESGGTGLGLAIAKSFVMKHGGIIRLQSKWGEGTTFTVRVPLSQKK